MNVDDNEDTILIDATNVSTRKQLLEIAISRFCEWQRWNGGNCDFQQWLTGKY